MIGLIGVIAGAGLGPAASTVSAQVLPAKQPVGKTESAKGVSAQTGSGFAAYPGIGRVASPAEVRAWDIDVRPDFAGLPAGKGSVARGMEVWESQCVSCHGTFGESNEVFTPIVGNTSADDIKRGRVAALIDQKTPQRTTLMKVATVSTLWDYIHRAMPWYAPRSLSVDDTYSVLSYILYLGDIITEDFVLSDASIAQVQARMPNRNGMTQQHGLWDVAAKPDVQGSSCMNNCKPFVQIGSVLPDHARNAHNNLADQNRKWGPFRGIDSTVPPLPMLPADQRVTP
jgi:cytochrome c